MKARDFILGTVFLALSLSASAHDAVQMADLQAAEPAPVDKLDVLRVAPCKTNGDGTYVEMITTMASVLPPAEADALLTRYCEECFRRKFVLTQTR